MITTSKQTIIRLDARGIAMGRLASRVAGILVGKNSAAYARHMPPQDQAVEIAHIGDAKFTGKKLEQKRYYRHSGYIGNLKEETAKNVFDRDPRILFRKVVRGMLPKNGQRDRLIKKITFVS